MFSLEKLLLIGINIIFIKHDDDEQTYGKNLITQDDGNYTIKENENLMLKTIFIDNFKAGNQKHAIKNSIDHPVAKIQDNV